MLLRNIFIFIYLLITVILFATFETTIGLWSSFFFQALILACIAYYHIFIDKDYSPFLSTYIVFSFLFFILAPIIQTTVLQGKPGATFDHNYPFKEFIIIKTCWLITFFHVMFFSSYVLIKGSLKTRKRIVTKVQSKLQFRKLDLWLIIGFSIIFLSIGFSFLMEEYFQHNWLWSSYSPGYQLVFKKVLFTLPLAGIVICKYLLDHGKKYSQNWLVIVISFSVLFLLLLVTKNPLVEKRNALLTGLLASSFSLLSEDAQL